MEAAQARARRHARRASSGSPAYLPDEGAHRRDGRRRAGRVALIERTAAQARTQAVARRVGHGGVEADVLPFRRPRRARWLAERPVVTTPKTKLAVVCAVPAGHRRPAGVVAVSARGVGQLARASVAVRMPRGWRQRSGVGRAISKGSGAVLPVCASPVVWPVMIVLPGRSCPRVSARRPRPGHSARCGRIVRWLARHKAITWCCGREASPV